MQSSSPMSQLHSMGSNSSSRGRRPSLSSNSTADESAVLLDNLEEEEPLIEHRRAKRSGVSWLRRTINFVLCRPNVTFSERSILFGAGVTAVPGPFARNVVSNQKYNLLTFMPLFLYEQFRYFFNLYFLLVALSQFIPMLQVGFLFTYVAPLVFVLAITMVKEGYEDFKRYTRDKEANSQIYERLRPDLNGGYMTEHVPSSKLQVGDIILLKTDQRVPADLVMLRTHDKSGSIFIRTDQLDGETDWKLRRAVLSCQKLPSDSAVLHMDAEMNVEAPRKEIYEFAANFRLKRAPGEDDTGNHPTESLNLENTLWANTVVASGTVIGCIVYTGIETRAVMNANQPRAKMGKLDLELNTFSKVLFFMAMVLSITLTGLKGFRGSWFIVLFRFAILLSSIIPISLRVNLDLGKTLYSILMMKDKRMPETVVRNSTIPEELGRISYLFSDKTGTLTQNVMTFHTLQMEPPLQFTRDTLTQLQESIRFAYAVDARRRTQRPSSEQPQRARQDSLEITEDITEVAKALPASIQQAVDQASPAQIAVSMVVRKTVRAIALCHNVTPVDEGESKEEEADEKGFSGFGTMLRVRGAPKKDKPINYQASSPDEVALVKFAESVGLVLRKRTQKYMVLQTPLGTMESYAILNIFPFTSESKRMGIIVRSQETGEILFILKGAESVMKQRIEPSEWLDEEVENLARAGLRTLVVAYKVIPEEEYQEFSQRYNAAKAVIKNRDAQVAAVIRTIENDMELLCLTGVEDKLQDDVKNTLETLRNAGIRVWMLTGDKAETAICIGRSARLIDRGQGVFQLMAKSKREAAAQLDMFSTKPNYCLVIDGSSLSICLQHFEREFIELACHAPSVICCRCSPTQKADIVALMRTYTRKRTASIGDGGNDVSMIQTADVGIGIPGKEGKQASLAADFSIAQFSYLTRLLLWHGRNSYKRSARLSQFVIHRGLIISVIQAVFSLFFYYAAIPIYTGWLTVGYATFYTMFPVFTLVLDEDVSEQTVMLFPQLYQELLKGRPLNFRTFFTWVFLSFYQGGMIMIMCMVLFDNNFVNIVGITFTALILAQLLNVALEIHKWHWLMVLSQVFSAAAYIISLFVLRTYFDVTFIMTWSFAWKAAAITAVAVLPPAIFRCAYSYYDPPAHLKVQNAY